MDLVKLAEQIAREAHGDQPRKIEGGLYIEHPRRVAEQMDSDDEKIVAWLHDVIEDTDVTATDLYSKGIPAYLVAAVEALTKRPRKEEEYMEYLVRGATNPIARRVKIADLRDNLRDLKPGSLRDKYTVSLYLLTHWRGVE